MYSNYLETEDKEVIDRAKKLLSPIKFGKFTICDAKRHDAMPPHMPHADTEGYSGRNLPGGGWLPERL